MTITPDASILYAFNTLYKSSNKDGVIWKRNTKIGSQIFYITIQYDSDLVTLWKAPKSVPVLI